MIFDPYLYIFIASVWLIYIINSFYQNYRMKRSFSKTMELFMTPFYIFVIFSSFFLTEKIFSFFYKNSSINPLIPFDNFYLFRIIIVLIGTFFLIASIVLYTYVNFFEKSFPSCITIKNKQSLKGIYNYIRHPSYYIFFSITFGTAFSLQSITLFLIALINHLSLYFFYLIEEKKFQKESTYYAEYLKKTKRFFPRFSKFS